MRGVWLPPGSVVPHNLKVKSPYFISDAYVGYSNDSKFFLTTFFLNAVYTGAMLII